MPIYVYECQKCSQEWEYMQTLGEAAKTECEKCGGKLEKVMAPTAFVLKGGGWYKDLYSSSSKSGGSSSGAESSSTKSEAKADGGSSKGESSSSSKSESSSSGSTSSSTSTSTSTSSGSSGTKKD